MDGVRAAEFEREVLASPVPVIVDFWAPWCKPCDAIEPHLLGLAEEWGERVRLVRVNVDDEPGLSSRYGVLSLPTVILFAGGEPKATVYGAQPRARFEREFTPFVLESVAPGACETLCVTDMPRYDGLAEWYEREFRTTELTHAPREALLRLVGDGEGRLLDVGCGTGFFASAMAERGWRVTGVDTSEDMLRFARERSLDVLRADGTALPFPADSFDAVMSTWTHTDIDDFPAMIREVARVLVNGSPFVYVGAHPCFVGPHSQFVSAEGIPTLHPGYWHVGRYDDGPGISSSGLRAKVGATHLPLGAFLQSFFDAGFRLDAFEEAKRREYPFMIALRCRV